MNEWIVIKWHQELASALSSTIKTTLSPCSILEIVRHYSFVWLILVKAHFRLVNGDNRKYIYVNRDRRKKFFLVKLNVHLYITVQHNKILNVHIGNCDVFCQHAITQQNSLKFSSSFSSFLRATLQTNKKSFIFKLKNWRINTATTTTTTTK